MGSCGDELRNDPPRRLSFISKPHVDQGQARDIESTKQPPTNRSRGAPVGGIIGGRASELEAHLTAYPSHSLHTTRVFISSLKTLVTSQCPAVVKVERYAYCLFSPEPAVVDMSFRVSERVEQSVTVRSFATTSRASPSLPSVVSLVEVASSVSPV